MHCLYSNLTKDESSQLFISYASNNATMSLTKFADMAYPSQYDKRLAVNIDNDYKLGAVPLNKSQQIWSQSLRNTNDENGV